jgi:hypothetical protein
MASDRPIMKSIRFRALPKVILTDLGQALARRPIFTFSQKRFRFTTIRNGRFVRELI